MSQLALKVVSLSVKESVMAAGGGADFIWPRPLAFVGLGGLAFSAPSQLILLSSALAARASLVVPMYQASLVSLTTLAGGTAFKEFDTMSAAASVCYGASMLVATAGLITLSRGGGGEADGEEGADAVDPPATMLASPSAGAVPLGAAQMTPHAHAAMLSAPLLVQAQDDEQDLESGASLDARLSSAESPPDWQQQQQQQSEQRSARFSGRQSPPAPPNTYGTGATPEPLRPRRRSSISLAISQTKSNARLPAPFGMGPLVAVLETREIGAAAPSGVPRVRSASFAEMPTPGCRGQPDAAATGPRRMRSRSTYS